MDRTQVVVSLKRTFDAVRHREWAPVLVLLFAAALTWGFVELADEVLEGETHATDRAILLAMRSADDLSDPIGPRWVEEMGRDLTALGGMTVLVLITVTVVVFLWILGLHRGAITVLVAVTGALVLSLALKAGFDRARPDLVPHGSHVYSRSFPSGHSMMAAATYLTLGMLLSRFVPHRRLRALAMGWAILVTVAVGVSRVYLGVHWPTDILAGWALGAAWALVCWVVASWLQQRGQIEEEVELDAGMK